ncbi:MAG: hypothetical protein V1748_07790 [Actinomycetota bacterium]
MSRNVLYSLAALIVVLFLIAIIGQFSNGSARWVQSVEAAGWICFVVLVAADYLLDRGPEFEGKEYTTLEKVAWACGALSIVSFAISLVAYAASTSPATWMEAAQLCGMLFMLGLLILSIYSRKLRDRAAG